MLFIVELNILYPAADKEKLYFSGSLLCVCVFGGLNMHMLGNTYVCIMNSRSICICELCSGHLILASRFCCTRSFEI